MEKTKQQLSEIEWGQFVDLMEKRCDDVEQLKFLLGNEEVMEKLKILFAQGKLLDIKFSKMAKTMQKNPGFRGLKNLKLICWLNGTIQCIGSLEFLSSYYSNNGHLDELINISEPKTSIFNLFSSLQIALKKSQPVPADSLHLAKKFC